MATNTVEKVIRIDVMTSATTNRQIKQLADQLKSIDKSSNDLNRSFRSAFGGIGGIIRNTLGVLGTLGVVNSLQEIVTTVIQAADAFGVLDARFRTLFGNADQARQAISDVTQISIASGKALDGVAKLYEKAIRAGEQFGITQEDAAKITEGFSQSLRVSGASTQEAQAALIQFGQALASGRLQGDEFRSLTENNAFFMNEFAKATGKTLAELRKLGTEGKLTTDFFLENLLKKGADGLTLLERINKTAETIPLTISQAFAALGTSLSVAIGQLTNFLSGAENSKGLIQSLAEEIDRFRQKLADLDRAADILKLDTFDRLKISAGEFFSFLGRELEVVRVIRFAFGIEKPREKLPIEVIDDQIRAAEGLVTKLVDLNTNALKQIGEVATSTVSTPFTNDLRAAQAALTDLIAKRKQFTKEDDFFPGGPDSPFPTIRTFKGPAEEDKDAEKRLKKLQQQAEQERNGLQRDLAKLFEQRLLLQEEIAFGEDAAKTEAAKLAAENTAQVASKIITDRDELRKVIAAEASEIDRLNGVLKDNAAAIEAEGEALISQITRNTAGPAIQAIDELQQFRDETKKSMDLIAQFKLLLSTSESASERSYLRDRIDELEKGLNPAARDFGKILEDNVGKALDSVSDKLADFLLGAEKNFSAVIDSILKNLIKLTVQDFITEQFNLFKKIIKGSSGGSSGIFDSIGGFFSDAFSLFTSGFADGGIMTARGSLPLKKYRAGGVANRPQLAMFGEGSTPEAYVPLPDGRSIPVSIEGGSGSNVEVNIYNQASGDTETTVEERRGPNNERQLDIYITRRIRDVVGGDIATGTGVARSMEGMYGLRRSLL